MESHRFHANLLADLESKSALRLRGKNRSPAKTLRRQGSWGMRLFKRTCSLLCRGSGRMGSGEEPFDASLKARTMAPFLHAQPPSHARCRGHRFAPVCGPLLVPAQPRALVRRPIFERLGVRIRFRPWNVGKPSSRGVDPGHRNYGSLATNALPSLLHAVKDTNLVAAQMVRHAIQKIAPETLTNNPTK